MQDHREQSIKVDVQPLECVGAAPGVWATYTIFWAIDTKCLP